MSRPARRHESANPKVCEPATPLTSRPPCQTWVEKSVICICIFASLYMILYYIRVLLKRFAIPAEAAITGKFERGEDRTTGVASGIKDANEIATLSTLIHTQARCPAATWPLAPADPLAPAAGFLASRPPCRCGVGSLPCPRLSGCSHRMFAGGSRSWRVDVERRCETHAGRAPAGVVMHGSAGERPLGRRPTRCEPPPWRRILDLDDVVDV